MEETLKRLRSQKGVTGTIIVNQEGIRIHTTLDNTTTDECVSHFQQLTEKPSVGQFGQFQQPKAKTRVTVQDDPTKNLSYLRLRTSNHETMPNITPGTEYYVIVVQDT